jgi:homoserine dehydrogenase
MMKRLSTQIIVCMFVASMLTQQTACTNKDYYWTCMALIIGTGLWLRHQNSKIDTQALRYRLAVIKQKQADAMNDCFVPEKPTNKQAIQKCLTSCREVIAANKDTHTQGVSSRISYLEEEAKKDYPDWPPRHIKGRFQH